MPTLHIRPATLAAEDSKRLLEFVDSQLPWLATVGSGAQWGSESRNNEESQAKYRSKVKRSEAQMDQPFSPDWIRVYIADAEVEASHLTPELKPLAVGSSSATQDGYVRIPVAAMVLDSKSSDYLRSVLPEQDAGDPFLFLHYLTTDRRTGSMSKGAGSTLIKLAKEEAKKLGLGRMCADCWSGNDRKLVR